MFKAGFRYTVEAFENSVPVDVAVKIDKDTVPVDVNVQVLDAKYDEAGGMYVTPRRRRRPKHYYVTPDEEWIAGEQTGNLKAFEHEYERHLRKGSIRGRISLILWFVLKNIQPLAMRGMMAAALIGVIVFMGTGGTGVIMESISKGLTKKKPPEQVQTDAKPAPLVSKETEQAKQESLKDATREEKNKIEKIREVYEEELKKSLVEKEALNAEKETLKADAEKVMQELKNIQDEIERQSALVLMTPDKIVFQGGYAYEVGTKIRQGKYKDREVRNIDYRNREALLDDGNTLSLAP